MASIRIYSKNGRPRIAKVVIAGASGFIGRALLSVYKDSEVVVLSRTSRPIPGAKVVVWDAKSTGDWAAELEGASTVINLCGAPITLKWTASNKNLILSSRVEPTLALGRAIAELKNPPAAWVNGSAVGFYGDARDAVVNESSPLGTGFLAETCAQWEAAQTAIATPHTRQVQLRTGFVLGRDGGALPLLVRLTRAFLGGSVGSGRQWVPWVHELDIARMFRWAAESEVTGPVIGSAPHPVINAEMMRELRGALHRPWSPPAPEFAIRLMGALLGPDAEVTLSSVRSEPKVAVDGGFEWAYPSLADALASLTP